MNVRSSKTKVCVSRALRLAVSGSALLLFAVPGHAGPNEQAKRIYERIAGVPPTAAVLS